ncbi:MAG: DNA (cytosine-5-)-methyltransferase [Solirubrobacterales bacterium]|nr:DNA (cytosine-5-)-methyltransferase [Solirubrobacterales bacterium]
MKGTLRMSSKNFTFIDLFAGIGGMRVGFEAAGGQCVFTSEWNKFSQETYRANFGPEPIAGDIANIKAQDIPDHDILVAGFPCQPFSLAGVTKKNSLGRAHGFADETQGTLFFEIARILKAHRPKAFLLENVKNLQSHDGGETFKVIKRVLKGLGYTVQAKVVDAKGFVPQHRERIFMVGFLEESGFSWDALEIPDPATGPRLRSILHPEDGTEYFEARFTYGPNAQVLPRYTLTDPLWSYLQRYAAKHKAKGNGFGFGLVGPNDVSRTLSARYFKDGAEILVRQDPSTPRRLTPRECSRLMGFDAPNGRDWIIPVSDTQAYRQFGNAVVPPLVEAIAQGMASALVGVPLVSSHRNIFSLAV